MPANHENGIFYVVSFAIIKKKLKINTLGRGRGVSLRGTVG